MEVDKQILIVQGDISKLTIPEGKLKHIFIVPDHQHPARPLVVEKYFWADCLAQSKFGWSFILCFVF